jgi:MFS superfamily sulfate permease-like transporter
MIERIFPFIRWFKNYDVASLRTDAISGLTVALVLIPQSMAYAQLAGLPAYYGLYASFLPPMTAALFGSSRQLATGPVAIVSLMTSASLAPLATAGSSSYVAYAVLLALMVGAFQLLLGVLRLGLVVNFLSHPVVNGFTNAAALIIASSQLSKLFGVSVDSAPHHYETIMRVVQSALHYTHWPTLGMGVLAFVIMYGLKRISPKIPNVLVAVTVTTLISWSTGFEREATVDISRIESPTARALIERFNAAQDAIPQLAELRTKNTEILEQMVKKGDILGRIRAEHDAQVISIRMEDLNAQGHECREALRELLFSGMPTAGGGAMRFVARAAVGDPHEGRTWRLMVGNRRLDPKALRLASGGAVVGTIPKGLPALGLPTIDARAVGHLLPYAIIISLLGFMEAISIAKAMAAKSGQRLDPNQELIGQGIANLVGAVGKSYPTSGSFSRSAVNFQAGAVSGLSSVFTSMTVIIVLLFFTPLLYFLPQAVLAAVIMMAVIGLINVSGFVHAWKAQWYDGLISIVSFFATLVFAPHLDRGIMVGVLLTVFVFLYKNMRPKVASLARTHDESLRCATTHGLQECAYIAMVRFDGPLIFANANYLEDQITEFMLKKTELKHIIIVSNGINDIDASGEETLSLLIDRVRSAGVDISLSGVNESVMAVLERTHLKEKIGMDHIFPTMEKAISGIHEDTHRGGSEESCPLQTVQQIALSPDEKGSLKQRLQRKMKA